MAGYLEFLHNVEYIDNIAQNVEKITLPRKDDYYNLGIGLTTRCNFKCPFCYYHAVGHEYTQRDMPLQMLADILKLLPRLNAVVIGLEGEPFCHPDIFEALDIITSHTGHINIVSNISLINKSICQRLQEYPISCFTISCDAADSKNYEAFRKGGSFNKFIKNAALVSDYFKEACMLHSVVFQENLISLENIPTLAKQININKISFQQLRSAKISGYEKPCRANSVSLKNFLVRVCAKADVNQTHLLFGSSFGDKEVMSFLAELEKAYEYTSIVRFHGCSKPFNYTSVLADGRLFPCCGDFTPTDIKEYSFDGIFNHHYLRCLRGLHVKGIIPQPCNECMMS